LQFAGIFPKPHAVIKTGEQAKLFHAILLTPYICYRVSLER
jgi:hypothetical protein